MNKKLWFKITIAILIAYIVLFLLAFWLLVEKPKKERVVKPEDVILTSSVLSRNLAHVITGFSVTTSYANLFDTQEDYIIYRKFNKDGVPSLLVVNPETLETSILPESVLQLHQKPSKEIGETKFYKLVNAKSEITKLNKEGYVLTINLHQKPIKKGHKFEEGLFEFLEKLSNKAGKSIPVAIAVSKQWIEKEPYAFERIIQMRNAGKINITWVNNGKFLTEKSVNFENEVLDTEKYLLEIGEIPSIFFRYPGLISNEDLQAKLSELHLISLGANAWLAKREKIKNGSIILVNGDGNEPKGIEQLMKEFKKKDPNFVSLY